MGISEIEFQRAGRNKQTKINSKYINSGEYRKKFNRLSDSRKLNRLVYKLAKKMLKHRSGTEYEDMYWIDLDTLQVVAQEVNTDTVKSVVYSNRTMEIVQIYKNNREKRLLTLHTHPSSFPPSIPDFNANFQNEYNMGLVICHDGKIFLYAAEEELNEVYYDLLVAKKIKQGYNEFEGRCMVLEEMQDFFKMTFREVTNNENGK